MTGDIVKERRGRIEIQTHKDHVKMKVEVEVMRPQGEKDLDPPEAARGENGSSPRAFGGSAALPTP